LKISVAKAIKRWRAKVAGISISSEEICGHRPSDTPDSKITGGTAGICCGDPHGTTTIGAKSGYGLDVKAKLRFSFVIMELKREQPLENRFDVFGEPMWLPSEYPPPHPPIPRRNCYPQRYIICLLINRLNTGWQKRKLAEFFDVFFDRGACTRCTVGTNLKSLNPARLATADSRDRYADGGKRNLRCNSGGELHPLGGTSVRLTYWILASPKNGGNTIGLVVNFFHLGLKHYAPARGLMKRAIVALVGDRLTIPSPANFEHAHESVPCLSPNCACSPTLGLSRLLLSLPSYSFLLSHTNWPRCQVVQSLFRSCRFRFFDVSSRLFLPSTLA